MTLCAVMYTFPVMAVTRGRLEANAVLVFEKERVRVCVRFPSFTPVWFVSLFPKIKKKLQPASFSSIASNTVLLMIFLFKQQLKTSLQESKKYVQLFRLIAPLSWSEYELLKMGLLCAFRTPPFFQLHLWCTQ